MLQIKSNPLKQVPEVGVNSKIFITKIRPNFFFNPCIVSKNLQTDSNLYKLSIMYKTYSGKDAEIDLIDVDGEIERAIDHLNNGITHAQKPKV